MVFLGIGIGMAGVAGMGTGWIGTGITGTGCIGAGYGTVGIPAGLRVCAGAFKTTSILIIVTDRNVRMVLFVIYLLVWLLVFGRRHHVAFGDSIQATMRAGHLKWGITR